MSSTLEALRHLQDIELQIVDIRQQLASKQRMVARQTQKVRDAEAAVHAANEELRRARMEFDELDLELKSRSANVAKLRDNLNSIKTNKEYAAVLSQLNNEKAEATRVETRASELMVALEPKKVGVTEVEGQLKREQAKLENLKTQLDQAKQSFARRLEGLEKERDAAATAVGDDALQLFNRVSERYDGEVMAQVVRTHPRRDEFMCEGCNMSLAAERANALLTRDAVVTCDNCGRILYIDRGRK